MNSELLDEFNSHDCVQSEAVCGVWDHTVYTMHSKIIIIFLAIKTAQIII